ncbi:uncharacterized protein DUF3306 [Breoghania corrubedonensis]|uniref:Uncharacterized protein DUF3306 n=1 Tax=Breoghania corrubedonensis TaxID=665038 RepID=A0A2T5VAT5_9HYPH|nr:DUF3306 domain-containing protein [Breoghania corrubedonensis]PTW60858.1 uncharacterized protein DUF3306 [Breoghania corrubedonensis]
MAEERFLSRWARRKNAAAVGAADGDAVPDEGAVAQVAPDPCPADPCPADPGCAAPEVPDASVETAPDEEELAANRLAAEAVNLETIGPATDMSVFLKKGVPAALKAVALRRLWTSDPVYACVDGLNDYDTDFTGKAEALKTVATRWQIGKGFAKAGDGAPEGGGEATECVGEALPPEDVALAGEPEAALAESPEDASSRDESRDEATGEPEEGAAPPRRVASRRRMTFDIPQDASGDAEG